MPGKLTISDFIERAQKVHGDKYDYSKVIYTGNTSEITIICSEHGEFEQVPKSHFRGNGCPECRLIAKRNDKVKQRTSEFIKEAQLVHSSVYDYSKTEYNFSTGKVVIICRKHGPFEQRAYNHTNGNGCRKCANKELQLGQDGFIIRAINTHNDKYDYSKVCYEGLHSNINIICKEHGSFSQVASTHLTGTGCPKCSGRISTQEFIQRSREKHGDKYDYSQCEYINGKTKVKIICPEHGLFEQNPFNHLAAYGCINCGFKNAGQYHKKDTEMFIVEAKRMHGETYDYSQVEYLGAREKVRIVCFKHGPFEQVAHVHLRDSGGIACLACSYESRGLLSKMKFDEFIQRSQECHNNIYNYSKAQSEYEDLSSNIIITCLKHGDFRQSAAGHISGRGCHQCGIEKTTDALRKSTNKFIMEAHKIHGDKYSYIKAKYVGARECITIICPVDGEFEQIAGVHLNNIGCPKCSRRKQGAPRNLTRALRGEFDHMSDAFIYVVNFRLPDSETELYKVGSGTGTRLEKVKRDLKNIGCTDITGQKYLFNCAGEAIVFEFIAHEQLAEDKFIVPDELKFPGYTEVFTSKPYLGVIETHPTLVRYRNGDRWDPREV